jgi:IS5 family transposase
LRQQYPTHSTLEKTAKRCGPAAVEAADKGLLEKAAYNKVLKGKRLRVGSTCVAANVGYPTGSGLMAKGVACLRALVGKLHGFGLATKAKFRDRSSSVRRRAQETERG